MKYCDLLPYANRLSFPGALEEEFRADFQEKSLTAARLALALGIILKSLFGLLDIWSAPSAVQTFWTIRYSFIIPILILALISTWLPALRRFMQPILAVAITSAGIGLALMSGLAQPDEVAYRSYFIVLLLVMMWGYTFVRMRFWYATTTGWLVLVAYEVVAIGMQQQLASAAGVLTFITDNTFLITANILGMLAAYFIERYARMDFLQRRIIVEEKRASEARLTIQAEEALRMSEEHYRSLVENSFDLTTIADREGNLIYTSPSYEQAIGYRVDELQGRPFAPLVHPDDLPRVSKDFADAFANPGKVINIEVRGRHKDGSWRFFEGVGKVRPDGFYVGNYRDITERSRVKEELRRLNEELEERVAARTTELEASLIEQRRLATIIETTPDYVGIADMQGRSLYINQAGKRMIGLSPEEDKRGFSVINCYPPEEHARAFEMVQATLRDEIWAGEMELLHKDGHRIPVSEVTFMLRDKAGNPDVMGTIIRDISQQKRVEAELKAAKEAAEGASRAKSTFLANMSHEIRTPMNAIIGMTGLLLNTPLNEKQRDFVETVRTSGDSLLTVINDILDFSKIEEGKMEMESQPFDLRACVESALDLLAPKAAETGLDLAYVMDESAPAGVVGDSTRLRQILVNLLSNAIKFTERGEVVVSIAATARSNGHGPRHELHFSVRDTGIGIPQDKMDRLFNSFTQLDASTTRQYGGTGLGLAISRRLAELMGGRMWAESPGVGLGTTFHFTISVEAASIRVRRHLQETRPELKGKRVLIVDDNPTNRRILSLQSQTWGMIPFEAASPSAALSLIHELPDLDIAFLDMHMPEMDGLTLAHEICTCCQGEHRLPVVLLTSVSYENRPESKAISCFAAYLTKPVKPSQLYDALIGIFASEPQPEQSTAQSTPAIRTGPLPAEQWPLQILLAEDVAVNQKFALLALEEMGYRADIAANGLEVLTALSRQSYDVILMDVQMPELDGLQTTRRIRSERSAAEQPYIVAMTANALRGDREICLEAGMDDYISKPVYLEELRGAMERAGRSRLAGKAQTSAESVPHPQAAALAEPIKNGQPAVDGETLARRVLKYPSGLKVIRLYLSDSDKVLGELRMAAQNGDVRGIAAATHNLKGISAYVGAHLFSDLCAAIEEEAITETGLPSDEKLQQLEEEFSRIRRDLNAVLDKTLTPA